MGVRRAELHQRQKLLAGEPTAPRQECYLGARCDERYFVQFVARFAGTQQRPNPEHGEMSDYAIYLLFADNAWRVIGPVYMAATEAAQALNHINGTARDVAITPIEPTPHSDC